MKKEKAKTEECKTVLEISNAGGLTTVLVGGAIFFGVSGNALLSSLFGAASVVSGTYAIKAAYREVIRETTSALSAAQKDPQPPTNTAVTPGAPPEP